MPIRIGDDNYIACVSRSQALSSRAPFTGLIHAAAVQAETERVDSRNSSRRNPQSCSEATNRHQQLAEHESEDASLADVALDELSATGTATSAAPSSSAVAQAKSMFYDVGIDDVVLGISNDPVGLVGCTVVLTFVFCAAQMVTPD